mmetsp:Transcript_10708/g.37467  ORF Transcript_10708/g.37467 Transcript_10708/m.37467 type:complete len:203 (-) Transcript_10708:149-757(-)
MRAGVSDFAGVIGREGFTTTGMVSPGALPRTSKEKAVSGASLRNAAPPVRSPLAAGAGDEPLRAWISPENSNFGSRSPRTLNLPTSPMASWTSLPSAYASANRCTRDFMPEKTWSLFKPLENLMAALLKLKSSKGQTSPAGALRCLRDISGDMLAARQYCSVSWKYGRISGAVPGRPGVATKPILAKLCKCSPRLCSRQDLR